MVNPIKILEFAFVVYPAENKERSRAFYEGILGLTLASSADLPDGFWLEYEIGPHTLAVGKEPFLRPSPDGVQLALEVEDLDAAVEYLKGRAVPFEMETVELPGCKAAIVVDPDGNKLGIHQRKHRAP